MHEPARHVVTLLFADLSRSTPLAAAMEAEHFAALLRALRSVYDEVVPRHGGLVVRAQGDGVLAMFGYPAPREDDGRRAVEAALELHARVAALPIVLPPGFAPSLHSGIHGGIVLIGAGDIERGRFELTGSVPHIASRLADQAQPHQILVSQPTLGPAARHFQTDEPVLLQLRGHPEPIPVLAVSARATLAGPAMAGATRRNELMGRDAELQRLQQQLAEAATGRLRVLTISGAPGLGKSSLVQALIEQAAGWRVLRGHCDAALDAEPMQPFAQMLRALEQPVDARAAQAAVTLKAALQTLSDGEPVLLFIDDWQWADVASHQVLQALRQLTDRRLMVLLTARPQDADPAGAADDEVLHLQPLAEAEAQRLAQTRLPGVDPFVVAEVCRHAGGNPLFLGELCQSLQRTRGVRAAAVRAGHVAESLGLDRSHGSAGWLAHLVLSRVQDLTAEQAQVIRAAAVVGNVVPEWLLEHLTGHRPGSAVLQALADEDLLFAGEEAHTLRFKHGLTREVIYDGLGLHQRELLHLRIAAAWQQRTAGAAQAEASEALAHHFNAGGDAMLAAHHAEQAADRALAASALDRARTLYRTALDALDRLAASPERTLRWIGIVHRLCLVSVYDPTRADLLLVQRALARSEAQQDPALTARARYWLSYIHYALGEAGAAVRHGERALAEAQATGDGPLTTQILATLGEAHTAAGQYGQALQRLDHAIEIKRAHRSGRRVNVGLAFSLVCRACVLGDRGDFDAALACFDDAATTVGGAEHEIAATVEGWRAAVLLWRGDWDAAIAAALDSRRVAHLTRSLAQYSIAHAIQGYARWMRDGDAAGLAAVEDATAWLAPRDTGIFRSLNHGWLTEGLFASGRRDAARKHAALAMQRARRSDRLGLAMAERALALDHAQRAEWPQAARWLARAERTAHRRESAHEQALNTLAAAQIALLRGEPASATSFFDSAAVALRALAMQGPLQRLARLQAAGPEQVLGRTEERAGERAAA